MAKTPPESMKKILEEARSFGKYLKDDAQYSDREVAVVVAAKVDSQIVELLQLFFIASTVTNAFLDSLTFSQKNQLAYLLGLTSKEMFQNILKLIEIRNIFAHNHSDISFDTEAIVKAIDKMSYGTFQAALYPKTKKISKRQVFIMSIEVIYTTLNNSKSEARKQKRSPNTVFPIKVI